MENSKEQTLICDRQQHPVAVPANFKVVVSRRFLVISFLWSSFLAFAAAKYSRYMLVERTVRNAYRHEMNNDTYHQRQQQPQFSPHHPRNGLPHPVLKEGKSLPHTIYSAKHMDTSASVTASSLLAPTFSPVKATAGDMDKEDTVDNGSCLDVDDETMNCSPNRKKSTHKIEEEGEEDDDDEDDEDDEDDQDDEEEHLPAGQHLLVDIKNVDGMFLNSVERLVEAMIELVSRSRSTLLSYHCHSLIPTGVSCVGVLLESHVSFHTWPQHGAITLDLFTCGSIPILPVLPDVELLFGIPRTPSFRDEPLHPPKMVWAHKLRGFRPPSDNPLSGDLGEEINRMESKGFQQEIASVETPFQQIDVWDFFDPKEARIEQHLRSLSNDDSYESRHPEYFQANRIIFLDGVMQSCRLGDATYHEPLVHPAMFAHSNPQRVAIVGGGEGATLREVLKHNTVKDAIMIEIDELMVNVSHEYIPSWSDCSDLIGSTEWCVEDSRANMYYEDALSWFINRFNPATEEDRILANSEPIDVIIMDALHPETNVPFADALYNNDEFLGAIVEALSDDGVLVMQLGEGPDQADPQDTDSRNMRKRAQFIKYLTNAGFESFHVYEEGRGGFESLWLYLVAFKSRSNRRNWYATSAQVELEMHKRLVRTHSGRSPLKYFDAGLLAKYQNPPKTVEVQYCKQLPTPADCLVAHERKNTGNAGQGMFDVKEDGIYAKVDIPKNSRVMCEEASKSLYFSPQTLALAEGLSNVTEAPEELKAVSAYLSEEGFEISVFGVNAVAVDVSPMNSWINGGIALSSVEGKESGKKFYDPVVDRNNRLFLFCDKTTQKDIKAGEMVLVENVRGSAHLPQNQTD